VSISAVPRWPFGLSNLSWFVVVLLAPRAVAAEPGAAAARGLALVDQQLVLSIEADFSGVVHAARAGQSETVVVGDADLRSGARNDRETRFWIGSLSKQFTAVAALLLVQKKKIALDVPVHTLLSELDPLERDGKSCTLRLLLQHRCGLAREDHRSLRSYLDSPAAGQALVDALNEASLKTTPGEQFAYSNLGYQLVGLIVQTASRMSYERFLRREVFEPLGMQRTGLTRDDWAAPGWASGQLYGLVGYLDGARWLPAPRDAISRLGAAGGLYSTVGDLAKFNEALHGRRLLEPKLYELMMRPAVRDAPKAERYGMGVVPEKRPWADYSWHNGAVEPFGFNSFLAWVPSTATTLVVLSNRSVYRSDATSLGKALLARLHGGQVEPKPSAFSFLFLVGALTPILTVVVVPYLFVVMVLLVWRGPRKGTYRWLADLCGNGVALFVLLAVYREPSWFPGLGAAVFLPCLVVSAWRRAALRAAPRLPSTKGIVRGMMSPVLGSLFLIWVAWYLLGFWISVACVVAAASLVALVLLPPSRGRGSARSAARLQHTSVGSLGA
jgi:CubicO group peptidase (beta-lactamase class C family)